MKGRNEYHGGRQMMVTDLLEFNDVDRVKQNWQRIKEEHLARESIGINRETRKPYNPIKEMVKGLSLYFLTMLAVGLLCYYQNEIINFFKSLFNSI